MNAYLLPFRSALIFHLFLWSDRNFLYVQIFEFPFFWFILFFNFWSWFLFLFLGGLISFTFFTFFIIFFFFLNYLRLWLSLSLSSWHLFDDLFEMIDNGMFRVNKFLENILFSIRKMILGCYWSCFNKD